MNLKEFEYLNKDIPSLKKDIAFRFLFLFLFVGVFVFQFADFVIEYNKNSLDGWKIGLTIFVLFYTLFMAMLCLVYAMKSYRILEYVKKHGHCVGKVSLLFSVEKGSFIKLYSILMDFFAVLVSLVFVAIVTYSILQITYFATISFYMPLLIMLVVFGYFSVYHITNEINIIKTVNLYHVIY